MLSLERLQIIIVPDMILLNRGHCCIEKLVAENLVFRRVYTLRGAITVCLYTKRHKSQHHYINKIINAFASEDKFMINIFLIKYLIVRFLIIEIFNIKS